jgi:AraC-like DNA-binding protein
MILFVEEGDKHVSFGQQETIIRTGCVGVIPERRPLTVENRLSHRKRFIARAICLGDHAIENVQNVVHAEGDPQRTTRNPRTVAAFDRAVAAFDDGGLPDRLREHAVHETLLWLAEDGIGFGPVHLLTAADKARSVIGKDLQRHWQISDVASALAMSPSTLRRRLAESATTFLDLLTDARMARALALLQTSDRPVTHIAQDVGYESPSRFAVRFRSRYGVRPMDIRGGSRTTVIERIGTQKERIGTAGTA